MTLCLFVSDLHGRADRYEKLLATIRQRRPAAVLLGGDLLPPFGGLGGADDGPEGEDFVYGRLGGGLRRLRAEMAERYPRVLVILGNDDPRIEEAAFLDLAAQGIWSYLHGRSLALGDHRVYGYSHIPPSPQLCKDWERYDVSRYVDPGCVSPESGWRTVPVSERDQRYTTIQGELETLAGGDDMERAVFLFHTPPYATRLDRAALDGKKIDHVPLDVHVGSMAVKRFIERRQPLLTLHGHVHESARLTGSWRDRVGRTHPFSAAHDGPELALVSFELERLDEARRELL